MRTLDFRQGDVGFIKGKIPATAKRIPVRPFALGERTGHSHRVIEDVKDLVEMYEDRDGTVWIRALADLPVRHEDHDPTASKSIITKDWEGEVRICVEYDEEQDFRRVID
jgi:hypothetical protein